MEVDEEKTKKLIKEAESVLDEKKEKFQIWLGITIYLCFAYWLYANNENTGILMIFLFIFGCVVGLFFRAYYFWEARENLKKQKNTYVFKGPE